MLTSGLQLPATASILLAIDKLVLLTCTICLDLSFGFDFNANMEIPSIRHVLQKLYYSAASTAMSPLQRSSFCLFPEVYKQCGEKCLVPVLKELLFKAVTIGKIYYLFPVVQH